LLIRDLGRVDHPDSDVDQLYHSLWDQILTLPDDTKLYPGRDYHGRTVTTVYEERHNNPFIKGKPSQEEFVRRVKARNLPPRSETKIDANKAQNRIFLPKESLEKIAPSDSWAPIERTLVGIPEVTVEWVHDFPRNYRIIDVRGTEEFTGPLGHIENAELVPLDTLATEARNWDPSQRYVAVCRSGGRSGRAATILESLGFTMVASMAGGMLHWNELYPQQ
jgi:rhodanese-related sulfurtransferase